MKTYVVDTYAWISYLEGKREFKALIEENELYTPSIVLAEISRILARKRVPNEKSNKILGFIKEHSLILSLDEISAVEAGRIADREGLYLIDGIIYSYVNENMRLLTGDKHFRNKSHADFIEHE